jgi:hypothetical protein
MKLFARIDNKRTIMITESQAMNLLFEAASIQDIYQKYYSNIPQDIFQQIISADPTYNIEKPNKMGKYGKWLLALYQKQNLKIEDLYKATQYLSTFIKFNAKLQQKDIMKYHSLSELYKTIEPFLKNPQQAATKSEEIRNIKEGAEKVYEDGKWLVVVPHTKEASCYYGKGTQWCTAADNSYNYFDQYNKRGLLYINILKGTDTKYQFHFETGSYMDATDTDILHPVAETIGLTDDLVNFYKQKYGKIAVIDLTTELYANELENITNLPNYYLYDEAGTLMKYNEQEQKFDILYTLYDGYEEFKQFDIARRFIPITKDYNVYINIFDTKYDKIVFEKNDNIDKIEFKKIDNKNNCDYIVIRNKNNTQRVFSLKTMTYTSEEFSNNYNVLTPLCGRHDFQYYNHDLTMIFNENDNYSKQNYLIRNEGIALYSLSQGKILSDFFKATRRETIYYNLNGKVTELQFEVLINKNNDYQEAMLIMYDGKLYPLNVFCQKSDQILDEYFLKNNWN